MTVRLTWQDDSANEAGHRVYRAEATMDAAALPPPLVELGPNVTEYHDTDVEDGRTYHYRVGAMTDGEEAVSAEAVFEMPLGRVVLDFETDAWQDYITGTWFVDDTSATAAHSGSRHLRSMAITHGEDSSALLDLSAFPATVDVTLHYRVSSESGYDKFSLRHNGTALVNAVSGERAWAALSFTADPGDTVEFYYDKDGSVSEGEDAAFVDLIDITPAG